MKYHFKLHKEGNSFWAECLELKNCFTSADSIDDLKKNAKEALNLHLAEPDDSKHIFPFPNKNNKATANVFAVEVEPSIAFSFVLRMLRLRRSWSKSDVSRKLKYSSVSAYAKLESPKANPKLDTLSKLTNIFPELRKFQLY